jgi:D-3-phosphoglycerate dehydrogenase
MGICDKAGRIAIFHKNITNMIAKFTSALGENGINISDLTNKSRKDVAYTMIDVETPVTGEIIETLEKISGVFRVRVVK